MIRKQILLAVVLLTAGVVTSSCSSDDAAIETPPQSTVKKGDMTFTATIAPKAAQTRSVNESGVTTWVMDEQIAVYYQKTDDSYGTATANVDVVNEGKATISATLNSAKNGGEVKFVYPASLVNGTGDDIDATKLQNNQHGTIADISANFDAATATATLATNGTTCGTTTTVAFTNKVLIGKFTPKYGGTAISNITTLTVSDGTRTYTVTPVGSDPFDDQGIYVAMLPVDDQEVIVTATTTSQNYRFGGKKISLAVGRFYNNLSIAMGKLVNLAALTADYSAEDGDVLTGELSSSYHLSINGGASVTLSGVTISDNNQPGIICPGNTTLVLSGTNNVSSTKFGIPGIYIAEDKTLTIQGCGAISATGSISAAGIGGGGDNSGLYRMCGNIRIESGTVNATGGTTGAGIGSGNGSKNTPTQCGDITIIGGTVNANGGNGAAGIGCGCDSRCGDISISGGIVTASIDNYYLTGTGIGCGYGTDGTNTSYKSITISGGTVTATGKDYGPGIGGGTGTYCSSTETRTIITITGGHINATGGYNAPGIGYATNNSHTTIGYGITISGATGTVMCGHNSAYVIGINNSSMTIRNPVTVDGKIYGYGIQNKSPRYEEYSLGGS